MKQTKESGARVVERPAEIRAADTAYSIEDEGRVTRHLPADWPWMLWERRSFLWRVAAWGLVLSTIVAFLIPNRYESTTRLMPPDNQASSGMAMVAAMIGKGSGLGSLASDLMGMKSTGDLFIDVLRSRTVEDRLIERFDLRRVYWDRYWQDARKDLAKETSISEDRKSNVITITVTDRDPQRAAKMAQAYVEELDRLMAQVSTSAARRQRIFIEQRLVTVKQNLDNDARQFSEYASKNTTLDLTSQGKATVDAAARLEGEMIVAQSELEGLQQIYTKDNVRVRSLQARVDELRSQLHKIGGETSAPVAGQPATNQEFPSIRQLPLLGVKWGELYRETKIQETVYELLTQQYELAKIEEAKEIPVVKVLDPADLPEKKSFPPRLFTMIFGTILALAGAVAWIFGRERWKDTDPGDSIKLLAQAMAADLRARVSRVSENNPGLRARLRDRFRRHPEGDGHNGNSL